MALRDRIGAQGTPDSGVAKCRERVEARGRAGRDDAGGQGHDAEESRPQKVHGGIDADEAVEETGEETGRGETQQRADSGR